MGTSLYYLPLILSSDAGPGRMFVRVADAVEHCATLAIRSEDLGQATPQNGHYHAPCNGGSVPGWREGSTEITEPLLVHESIDNA